MALTQAEADVLLQMEKRFSESSEIVLTRTLPMDFRRELLSLDQRERFFLDVCRSSHIAARLRHQTRARASIILARLEINGPRHRNPATQQHPEGDWIGGTHLHVYREGLGDRFAYAEQELDELGFRKPLALVQTFEDFLKFCSVVRIPNIQQGI